MPSERGMGRARAARLLWQAQGGSYAPRALSKQQTEELDFYIAAALDAERAEAWEEAARVADEWNDQQGTGREIASVLRARAAELREEKR